MSYLPVGAGRHHYLVVDPAGRRWFVTVDELMAKLFGMLGPTYVPWVDVDLDAAFDALDRAFRAAVALRAAGLEFVHAPITRADGDVLARLDDDVVSVFPFIDAVAYQPARDGRRRLLAAVGRLHAGGDAIPPDRVDLPHGSQQEDLSVRRTPRHQELRLLGGGSLRSAADWGTTWKAEMKALRLAAGFALVLGLAGCGESDEGAQSATVMPDVVGQQLDAALTAIEDAGFEDDVDVSGGGTFGIVDESNWTVCDQTPAAGASITDAPRLAVDRSCDDDGGGERETTTEPTETAESSEPAETSAPPANEVLTAANNAELAAILAEPDYCSDTIGAFAATHRGQTIEFDGRIATMGPHGDDNTRYDILLYPGGYSDTATIGPAFQLRDVGIADLHLTGPTIPDAIGQGDNIHVVAEVMEFDATQCLFFLDPVSTTMR